MTFTPDPELFPFQSRWFDGSAGRIHYVDEGSGPTLLLCHGNPMWSFLYRHIIIALRGRFRCVAADLPGFGLSERPSGYGYTAVEHVRALGELVDHLDLADFVLVGQDWGGPTALGVGVERADRVRGVVLGNTWFWPATPYFKAFSLVASSPPGQYLIRQHNLFVKSAPKMIQRELSDRELEHYLAVQPTPSDRSGVARFPGEIRQSPLLGKLEHAVPELLGGKPAVVVWGMKDRVFRPGDRDRLRAAFTDQVYVELPDAGHYIQEDAPEQIAEAISARFAS